MSKLDWPKKQIAYLKRWLQIWLPLLLSVIAISFTAAQYYIHDYPRSGLLLQSLPSFGMFATRDLDPDTADRGSCARYGG